MKNGKSHTPMASVSYTDVTAAKPFCFRQVTEKKSGPMVLQRCAPLALRRIPGLSFEFLLISVF
jgi:hypothetical protein